MSHSELLKDKICLVTGASRGIGKAISDTLVNAGAIVYANARTEGSIETLGGKEKQKIPIYFDVTDTAAAKKAIMQIKKERGRLDVLVNNAGTRNDRYRYVSLDRRRSYQRTA